MGKRVLTEEQLQARREYNKRYREAHRDKENERQKRFRKNNPDRVKEINRKYRENKIKNNPPKVLSEEEKIRIDAERKERAKLCRLKRYERNFISVEKRCEYCGSSFMTQYKKSKTFCSDECKNKQSHYKAKIAEKRRKNKIMNLSHMDPDITLPLLYDRDNGVCKICGEICDYRDYIVSDSGIIVGKTYPSIDHIIPISKGGSHTWDNVQLAHKLCNSIKSDKI